MGEMSDELAEEIKKGANLAKVEAEALEAAERAKQERLKALADEAERIRADLIARGIDPDAEDE
jgi:hypothetical protein